MAGRKVWAADEVLSADDLQDYIQDQVVFVYESSGARASGILSPTEGMVSYLRDTNQVSVYNGTAWVDIAPDVGTPGTYTKVTTDFKGRVTAGTTLAAADIPVINASSLPNVGTSGTFTKVGVDEKGRVVTGTTLNADDVPTIPISKTSGLQGALDGKLSNNTGTHTGLLSLIAGVGGAITANGQIFTSGIFRSTSDCWVDGVLQGGSVSVGGNITGANTFNQTNTGRAMFVNSAGLYGIGASSRRFKENIVDAEIDTDKVLDIRVRKFNYKKSFDETMPEDIGVIAEELEDLGLTDFIYYDAEGVPDGVAYEKLALALIPVLKKQQAQIDSVVARLDELEK
jgi:hypothetical protein